MTRVLVGATLCLVLATACQRGIESRPDPVAPTQRELSGCLDPYEPIPSGPCWDSCTFGNRWRVGDAPVWIDFWNSEERVRSFRSGSVAIAHEGGEVFSVVESCELDRRFVQVAGTDESRTDLFVSTRVLVRASELGPGCADATHVAVAYVVGGNGEKKYARGLFLPMPSPIPFKDAADQRRIEETFQEYSAQRDKEHAGVSGEDVGELLEFYTIFPDTAAFLLVNHLSDMPAPLSCFIAAEAAQQIEDPEARPIEWTDPELEGCAALPMFDVCFASTFRPARLEADQCPESQPTQLHGAVEP